MAKEKETKYQQPVRDLSYWFSDQSFVPSSWKESTLWFAQSLFFAKLNSQPLVDPRRVAEYRKVNRMEINRQTYIDMIDPVTPMGGGGTAEFFASDFKANPINIHLDNILRARLDKIGETDTLEVNEIDKFAKSQRQIEKDKSIYQREFRRLINSINKDIGLPPIKENESPYDYAKALNGDDTKKKVDSISMLMDQIKTRIVDDKDWAIYERYVYKGDIERAFEMGIKHYMINQNKWRVKSELFIDDIRNFNSFCGRAYTDQTTGRLNIEYFSPETLFTNPFIEKNGEDILYWFRERDITFGDFVRQFGTTLTDEQLKEVFEINKIQGASHSQTWSQSSSKRRNSALIRVGYYAVLTQEDSKFSEEYVQNNIPTYIQKPLSWEPDTESNTQKRKIYNVWYSCYYIPPPGQTLNSSNIQASWQWQSQYIFNIEKDMDMYRYGTDMRYAKSQLVCWKDLRPSFTDVEQAYMPKIHTTWHKFQNCLVQDTTAIGLDYDLIGGLLNAVDEGNKINPDKPDSGTGGNGQDAAMAAWRSLKQGGIALLKFRDKNGQIVVPDPSKLFVMINSGHLEKAEKYLEIILNLYNQMVMSLAQSDVTQGITPKPRTPVEGIQAALEASDNGIWFIEKPVREMTIMFAERFVQHILCMVKEKKKYGAEQRWNEFADVIGLAQALMLEGIEDMEPEQIGLTVSLENTESTRQYIFNLANQMATNSQVSWESAGLVIDTLKYGSYKYAYALLMLAKNEQDRKNQEQEELLHQRQLELGQQQLQIAQTLEAAKAQGKNENIQTKGNVDAALDQQINQGKYQSQAALVQQRHDNKLESDQQKSTLKKEENTPSPIDI